MQNTKNGNDDQIKSKFLKYQIQKFTINFSKMRGRRTEGRTETKRRIRNNLEIT